MSKHAFDFRGREYMLPTFKVKVDSTFRGIKKQKEIIAKNDCLDSVEGFMNGMRNRFLKSTLSNPKRNSFPDLPADKYLPTPQKTKEAQMISAYGGSIDFAKDSDVNMIVSREPSSVNKITVSKTEYYSPRIDQTEIIDKSNPQSLLPRNVVRIEGSDGTGIFNSSLLKSSYDCIINVNDKLKELGFFDRHRDFKSPYGDPGIEENFIAGHYFCGYKTVEQLQKWIMPDEIIVAKKAGFKFTLLTVTDYYIGNDQIVFTKESIIESKDITDIF